MTVVTITTSIYLLKCMHKYFSTLHGKKGRSFQSNFPKMRSTAADDVCMAALQLCKQRRTQAIALHLHDAFDVTVLLHALPDVRHDLDAVLLEIQICDVRVRFLYRVFRVLHLRDVLGQLLVVPLNLYERCGNAVAVHSSLCHRHKNSVAFK